LREQSALLVIDNMESVLLPPFMKEETPEALSQEAAEELKAILALCERLLKAGDTRLIFTSREALPAPFDAARHRRELHQLDHDDAVKLIERVLNVAGDDAGASSDAAREEIEQLVSAVHCHARTLALLAPSLQKHGVETTRESLVELMAEMDKNFPGSREKSVFASVELSLRRLSVVNQQRVRVLGMFHSGVHPEVLTMMMEWKEADVASLVGELIETGLATPNRYGHLRLNPALCPYLRAKIDGAEYETLIHRWSGAMLEYTSFLVHQQGQNAEVAATLTMLELSNLIRFLDIVESMGNAKATIALVSALFTLLKLLGKPLLLKRVCQVRDAAAASCAVQHCRHPDRATSFKWKFSRGTGRCAAVAPTRLSGRGTGVFGRRLRCG
jgi:hypothetical protein